MDDRIRVPTKTTRTGATETRTQMPTTGELPVPICLPETQITFRAASKATERTLQALEETSGGEEGMACKVEDPTAPEEEQVGAMTLSPAETQAQVGSLSLCKKRPKWRKEGGSQWSLLKTRLLKRFFLTK